MSESYCCDHEQAPYEYEHDCDCDYDCDCDSKRDYRQYHVHEFLGSVYPAGKRDECHTHRFAGVSSPAKPIPGGHIHFIDTRTDFSDGHYHEICQRTSGAIYVGGGKHVHFVYGVTTRNDGHYHRYQIATLIE